jgi:glycosyltransferase involved in cell wall biosynthesis
MDDSYGDESKKDSLMNNNLEVDKELTVLMPCLNEVETLAICIHKAQSFIKSRGINGEVLIADNGSNDGSQEIATNLGARVIDVAEKGYGAALLGGIQHAKGRYVIMGDADDSYDFSELDGFVQRLRAGSELVMGNRFQGGIEPGAMPFLHKYLGNPVLSMIGRVFFNISCGDFHCGLRGFNRQSINRLQLNTTGMEFASEMVVRSSLAELKIDEVPTKLHPDGRTRSPHLQTWRDGWRHLCFLFMYSPNWLFFYPACLLLIFGVVTVLSLFSGSVTIMGVEFENKTFFAGCLSLLVGFQCISLGVVVRKYALRKGFLPMPNYKHWLDEITLELGALIGLVTGVIGGLVMMWCVFQWYRVDFGELPSPELSRLIVLSMTFITCGIQTFCSAFIIGVMGIKQVSTVTK